jgi:protein-lysine N-methyltransferase EEF2KMT
MIDGRVIGDGKVGAVTKQIQRAYKAIIECSGVLIPRSGQSYC